MFEAGIKAVHWLNPLVYVVGLAVGAWAYWLSRKRGYLLVTVYFLFAVCSTFIVPAINRAMAAHWNTQHHSQLSPEAHEQFIKEYSALLRNYYPPENSQPAQINIEFPFGPIILVLGLSLLAKREPRKITEPGAGADDPKGGRGSA
jgi:hypothetical protein